MRQGSGRTLVEAFGSFLAQPYEEAMAPELASVLKLRILDLFGAAVAGMETGGVDPFIGDRPEGPATCWLDGSTTWVREAAFLNSFVSHAAYMEDGSRFTGGHPASVVIPAALAIAEQRAVSGRRLLVAILRGYEVFLRVGRAGYPSLVRRGMQSTAMLGALGSAAACAVLRDLDATRASHALAISANLGFGLKAALSASLSQPVQVARSCEGGILAALAAERGAQGALRILEEGLLPLFGSDSSPAGVTAGLGENFCASETYVKIHGGCRGNHAPLDVVAGLMNRAAATHDDVEAIRLCVDTVTDAADIHEPMSGEQAQFSARYAVAALLLHGDALPHRYSDRLLSDGDMRELMNRITVVVDRALDEAYPDKRGASATINLRDGRVLSGSLDNARGEPEDPLDAREIEKKFMALAGHHFGVDAPELVDRIEGLEKQPDIHAIMAIIARAALRARS